MPPLPRFDYTLPVLQLMRPTANVTRTSPSASAFRAAIDMVKARVSSLAVMEGESGKMLGILTERDFFMKLPLANKGQSRLSLVSELMTPAGSIVTAKPSHTVLQCVSMMRKHKVRNLPVVDKQEEVQAVLGMQDVSRQIFNTFKKGDAEAAAITIGDLLDDRGVQTPGLSASLPHTASVADAIGRMRELSSGSLLVTGDDAKRFGLFTERDFLYNVVLYDECVASARPSTPPRGAVFPHRHPPLTAHVCADSASQEEPGGDATARGVSLYRRHEQGDDGSDLLVSCPRRWAPP